MKKGLLGAISYPSLGKGMGVGLFLLCCPTLMAQDEVKDPFPDVVYGTYADNMTFFGQVRINGEIQPNGTIIAVYCGNEIRGKGTVQKQGTSIDKCARFTIGGETAGDPLHFKVFTGGRIIEVDQNAKYETNTALGSRKEYYYIDLPAPVVTNTSSEGWATTCLPFNAEIPEGVTAYAATAIEDGQLKVEPIQGTILPANTPVLVDGSSAASCEWLARVATADKPQTNLFLGTTERTTVEPNSVFTLGHANNASGDIGFWKFTGTTIPANRAYLKVDNASGIKGFTWLDDADGIRTMNDGQWAMDNEASAVYDLSGRQIVNRQLPRGIYVSSGKKYVVK